MNNIKDRVCYVVGAGDFYNSPINPSTDDLVIAVDGGYKYLSELGIESDILIGDFDSLNFIPVHPNIVKLQKEKDDTDMVAALKIGLERNYKIFHIYGGTGGRFAHTLANLQCLTFLACNHAQGFLYSQNEIITVIQNSKMDFDDSYTGYISVFSHSDISTGVNINGLKYKLDNAEIVNSFPLGVSNEFIGERGTISVKEGTLIIIYPH